MSNPYQPPKSPLVDEQHDDFRDEIKVLISSMNLCYYAAILIVLAIFGVFFSSFALFGILTLGFPVGFFILAYGVISMGVGLKNSIWFGVGLMLLVLLPGINLIAAFWLVRLIKRKLAQRSLGFSPLGFYLRCIKSNWFTS